MPYNDSGGKHRFEDASKQLVLEIDTVADQINVGKAMVFTGVTTNTNLNADLLDNKQGDEYQRYSFMLSM